MTLNEKAIKTVEKLLKLTQEGKIEWARFTDTRSLTAGTDCIVDAGYKTEYANSYFRIYESRYKSMDDEGRLYWTSDVVIELTDWNGVALWRLPLIPGMWDLLEAVQVKSGAIEDKLDEFLGSE